MTRHAITPEPMLLFCPRCHAQHEDFGAWAHRPHRKHLCHFCKHVWLAHPFTTVGVPFTTSSEKALIVPLAVFEQMPDYSCTLPTGPREEFIWRRRIPYVGSDRENVQYFAITVAMPDDPPGQISIVWRRLFVAEWLAGDMLGALLGGKAAA